MDDKQVTPAECGERNCWKDADHFFCDKHFEAKLAEVRREGYEEGFDAGKQETV